MIRLIKSKDHKTTEWSGGKTSEIFIWPTDGNYSTREFDYRLSSAIVAIPESDFTMLEGYYRYITVLDGELDLSHEDEINHVVKDNVVYGFSGGIKTHSKGLAVDFNLICKSDLKCEMIRKEIERDKSLSFEHPEGFLGIYITSGEADITLENDDKKITVFAKESVAMIICTVIGK